jgi:hypothetical protein
MTKSWLIVLAGSVIGVRGADPVQRPVPPPSALWLTEYSERVGARVIPESGVLQRADAKYLVAFEVRGDLLVGKAVREAGAESLGVQSWNRILILFPAEARKDIVQFNIQDGRRWAGGFDGDGENDVGRKGYRLSVAKYAAAGEEHLADARRPVSARRGTLDWTLVHELGHYFCLREGLIEKFSEAFDGDTRPQPTRRPQPDDYPEDGSPRLDGNFVTSYAERNAGDEEAVETFTTFLLVKELPDNKSLAAKKLHFFAGIPKVAALRQRIQSLN